MLHPARKESPRLLWRAPDDLIGDPYELMPLSVQWSSDGRWIWCILADRENMPTIYQLDPQTLVLESVVQCEEHCLSLAPSPRSNQVVFASFDSGEDQDSDGTLSLLQGGEAKILVRSEGVDHLTRPAWSPDGLQIAFTMQVEDHRSLFMVNVDGTGLVQLTENYAGYTSVAWSPDGKMLAVVEKAYLGSSSVRGRIALLDLETGEVETLLLAPWAFEELLWVDSASGNAFHGTRSLRLWDVAEVVGR